MPRTLDDGGSDEGVAEDGPRRHRHQVAHLPLLSVQSRDERVEFLGVDVFLPEIDDINAHLNNGEKNLQKARISSTTQRRRN